MKQAIIIAFCIAACSIPLTSFGLQFKTNPPLINAVIQGDTEKVKSLLASGAKVDVADGNGWQALHEVALSGSGDSAEVTRILLAAGAKVDAVDKQGRQPIIFAVEGENIKVVKVLLAAGAKANTVDNNGLQLIHVAAKTNSTEMVKLLFDAGALIDAPDKNGDTPLHWASRVGNTDMVKALIAAGANPNAADKDGDQPLHWAARYGNYGNTEMVKALLAAGAKEDSPNKAGEQPITIIKHIGPDENYFGGEGSLDEASFNYIRSTIDPILIRAKLCTSAIGNCGGDIFGCYQSSSLSCEVYGISDENVINEITSALKNSGLRIGKVTFWHSKHGSVSFFEKPLSIYDGHAGKDNVPIGQKIMSMSVYYIFWIIPTLLALLMLVFGPAIIILFSKKAVGSVKKKWVLYCLASVTVVPFLLVCLMEAEIDNKPLLASLEWNITPMVMLAGWIVFYLYNKRMGFTPVKENPWPVVKKGK